MKCSTCGKDFAALILAPGGLVCGWCNRPGEAVPERTALTIREQFAMAAMGGLMASPFFEKILAQSADEKAGATAVADASVEMADALILALSTSPASKEPT